MKELIVKSPKESIPFLNTKTFTPEKKKRRFNSYHNFYLFLQLEQYMLPIIPLKSNNLVC